MVADYAVVRLVSSVLITSLMWKRLYPKNRICYFQQKLMSRESDEIIQGELFTDLGYLRNFSLATWLCTKMASLVRKQACNLNLVVSKSVYHMSRQDMASWYMLESLTGDSK